MLKLVGLIYAIFTILCVINKLIWIPVSLCATPVRYNLTESRYLPRMQPVCKLIVRDIRVTFRFKASSSPSYHCVAPTTKRLEETSRTPTYHLVEGNWCRYTVDKHRYPLSLEEGQRSCSLATYHRHVNTPLGAHQWRRSHNTLAAWYVHVYRAVGTYLASVRRVFSVVLWWVVSVHCRPSAAAADINSHSIFSLEPSMCTV